MEFHSDCGEESNDKKSTGKVNVFLSPQAKQKKKLGSILNFEMRERSYDDLHPQVLKNVEKSKGFHQKHHVERKLHTSEELVKYMSYLPSYLERGENPNEKPLNIGVLDWRLLEKWKNKQNDISPINDKHSSSSNKTSSFVFPEGSSSHCIRGNSWSRHQQKISHPSTPSHLSAPPTEGCSSGTKLLAGNGRKFPDCKTGSIDSLKLQHCVFPATQSSSLDTVNRLNDCDSKGADLQRVSGTRSQHCGSDSIISGVKGNHRIQNVEALKAKEQVPSSSVSDNDLSERCKTMVPKPTDSAGNRRSSVGLQSDSSKEDNHRSLEANRHGFCGGSNAMVCHTEFTSDYTDYYTLPSEGGKTKDSQVDQSCSEEIRSINCPSDKEQMVPFPRSVSIDPSQRKNLEEKNSGSKLRKLAESEGFQVKMGVSESPKVRNHSPTRRFSFDMVRIGKSSRSNLSTVPYPVSENIPDSKETSTSACSSDLTYDKSNDTGRARSSPLRRLLEPLLKPKGRDSHHFARSSERNPLTTNRTLKSSSGQRESPASHSVKVKLDLKGCRAADICGPHERGQNGSSTVQALLQVAVKNGLPLFTFTVDNCSDILAATVKELSSKKTMHRSVYTFFSFSEMKKKNVHLINQESKDRNHGYISNIVAQMKVSDIPSTNSNRQKFVIKSSIREFVLSSMGTRDVDQTSDSLPVDELAAIVVKFPEKIDGQLNQDCLKDPVQEVRNCSKSRDDKGNGSASDDVFSAMVILPGGHHGLPSKGEPWPLIERWKSGGSCDCGGWDLGCRIRVLSNSNLLSQRFNSTKSQLTTFKLFSQEEAEEKKPMFVLSPFEDGIYSVEFDSSLKLIQAFSISIAVLNSRKTAVLSPNMYGGKISEEIKLSENTAEKTSNRAPVEVSAKYVSYPPLSPVGRV